MELIKVATKFLMLGIAFIVLRGLKTLIFLNAFKFILALTARTDPIISTILAMTMRKSMTFHVSLR